MSELTERDINELCYKHRVKIQAAISKLTATVHKASVAFERAYNAQAWDKDAEDEYEPREPEAAKRLDQARADIMDLESEIVTLLNQSEDLFGKPSRFLILTPPEHLYNAQ